jgi:hypothetical protein
MIDIRKVPHSSGANMFQWEVIIERGGSNDRTASIVAFIWRGLQDYNPKAKGNQ